MSEVTRVAIVGTGNAARQHAAALGLTPGCELTAICGRDLEKARALAHDAGAGRALSIADALASPEIDAMIIALPANAQPDIAVAAFERGKHVLCEKPLAPTLSEAESIERAWRRSGKVGMVNFCFRSVPEIEAFKAQLRAGVCGALNLIQVEWILSSRLDPSLPFNWKADVHAGGGVLQNFGSHVLDYLFHDAPDVRVLAAHQTRLTQSRPDASGTPHPTSGDETATVLFELPGMCPVFVHLSLVTRPQLGHRMFARGSEGTLTVFNTSADSAGGPFTLIFDSALKTIAPDPIVGEAGTSPGRGLRELFQRVHARFRDAIVDRRTAYAPDISAGVAAGRLVQHVQRVAGQAQAAPTV